MSRIILQDCLKPDYPSCPLFEVFKHLVVWRFYSMYWRFHNFMFQCIVLGVYLNREILQILFMSYRKELVLDIIWRMEI